MKLNVATVLNATGARVLVTSDEGRLVPAQASSSLLQRTFSHVGTDSRSLHPDSLFVALRGERGDGHDFVPEALALGAGGCFIAGSRESSLSVAACPSGDASASSIFFVVPDPLVALQKLAKYWRQGHDCDVIGITGSLGKTTTKEVVAALLSEKMPVLKSEANLNTEIGLPLTLLRLESVHRAAVLEMGMHGAGEIALLAAIASPHTGIVTNVAPIHLERLGTLERIARAKSELVEALPESGLAVLNADDPWTRAMARTSGISSVLLVGFAEDSDYRAVDVLSHGLEGTSFTVEAEGVKTPIRTRIPGAHLVHAVLFAIAVGRAMEMTWIEIQEVLADLAFDARQRILETDGILIIDDTYNASPLSVAAALQLLSTSPGNKVAVLGDMLELGEHEEEAHRRVGEQAAQVVDWLVLRGPRTRWIAEGAQGKGLDAQRILRTESNAEAVRQIRSIISEPSTDAGSRPIPTMQAAADAPAKTRLSGRGQLAAGNVSWSILVKGSRGMRMEEVVEGLRGGQ